nr:hypothetical protein [uncultured Roseateles sp.]
MNTLIRIVLAWLLALAIPVQGIAATAMLMCAPSHAGAGVMVESHMDSAPAAQHAAMLADCQDEQDADMAAAANAAALFDHCGQSSDQADQADPHSQGHEGHQKSQGHCSACAACCGVAAIGQTLMSLPVMLSTGTVQISPLPQSHDRELCGGIERPPRSAQA